MHRFRKWSDPRRSQVPESARSSSASNLPPVPRTLPSDTVPTLPLPTLPPVSDFRTSLILPDLSRRFTLLRSATGDPVSIEELRDRFAEQRARGEENQVSQEEEDMILETLGRLRAKASVSSSGGDSGYHAGRDSVRSTNTTTSSLQSSAPSSPSGNSKRYSNNLFGSKGFKDYSYIRSQRQRDGSSRSAISSLSSASSRFKTSDGPIPEDSVQTSDASTAHGDQTPVMSSSSSLLDSPGFVLEQRLSRGLHGNYMRRASMALEQVIREIEEEAEPVGDEDDKVLVPRSPISATDLHERIASHQRDIDTSQPSSSSSQEPDYETGTAVTVDHHGPINNDLRGKSPSPYPRSANTSPTPRLPGYIPGMPRPMTPRDMGFESDDPSPSSSTTPRATSPRLPNDRASPAISLHVASSLLRRESTNSRQGARAGSPLATNAPFSTSTRSLNGRYTPEEPTRSPDESYIDFGSPSESSVLGRHRPASPLSGPAYQPMSVSSRPGTPSSVTWKTPSSPLKPSSKHDSSISGHSRNGSALSYTDYQSSLDRERPESRTRDRSGSFTGHARNDSVTSMADVHDSAGLMRSKSAMSGTSLSRSLRSPALPDSPLLESGHNSVNLLSSALSSGHSSQENRARSNSELGSSMSTTSHPLRSPTPTQYAPRNPASPTYSDFELSPAPAKSGESVLKSSGLSSPFALNSHPLVLSPLVNSSRSSLESAGSSYHSWDAENKQDRTIPLFAALEPQQPAWHDLSSTDKSSSSASAADPVDPEEIVQHYAGLSKSDFAAIQDKLVFTARVKADSPEVRERNNSLRRRRPSTSQSNHSNNGRDSRAADPVLSSQLGHGASQAGSVDNSSKASALLDSVLDSIQSPRVHPINVHVYQKDAAAETAMHSPTDTELSSPSRRRRALADALFGGPEADRAFSLPELTGKDAENDVTTAVQQMQGEANQIVGAGSRGVEQAASIPQDISIGPTDPTPSQTSPVNPASASTPTYTDHNELAKEVQRRAEAATAQLRKMPSNPKINDNSASAHKKRISPNQISSPRLVSASTSVDTIPLRSPSAASGQLNSSKLGQRFKKLRGTLRSKQTLPTGQYITPYPVDLLSPASAQTDRYGTTSPTHDAGAPVAASATDLGRFKVPVPSPPASAGPGLKGFMARARTPRSSYDPPDADRRKPPVSSSTTPLLTVFGQQQQPSFAQQSHSAPAGALSFDGHDQPPSSQPRGQDAPATSSEYVLPQIDHSRSQSDAALRQLFDAAENLGLDQAALNDLLARSGSMSSKSTAPKWSSKHTSASTSEASGDQLDLTAIQRVRSPTSSDGRPSMERFTTRQVSESTVRKLSLRKQAPRTSTSDAPELPSAVLRRTLIFPAEARQSTADFNVTALRKSSSMRRRRASSASALSNRSVHDRVPTPPPPRSPTSSRFSPDPSPPVPELPAGLVSLGEGSQSLLQPPLPLEKSSSAYDSLYEMYAGDGKPSISITGEASTDPAAAQMNFDGMSNMEPGSAVEVLELANGETIWSIVNGLRDDDAESYYGNRASFRSEYSFRDNDGVQVFFKDHGRKTSKDSNASYLSRRKTYQSQAAKRPETKVFFSSSQQIGRLIDNLSQGMEAGSFNIIPSRPSASSAAGSSFHSESDTHWTVEERLEHMLGSMATT